MDLDRPHSFLSGISVPVWRASDHAAMSPAQTFLPAAPWQGLPDVAVHAASAGIAPARAGWDPIEDWLID